MSSKWMKSGILTVIFLLAVLLSFYCSNSDNDTGNGSAIQATSAWLNVYDSTAQYVGMQTCRTCHESIYETYIRTGMGQSFDWASKTKSAANFDPNHAIVYDKDLDLYYKPYWQGDSLYFLEFRVENGDTVHKRRQKIDYIIGSGQHTNSHIFTSNGYVYQAPITFYTQKGKWDLAPGFENGSNSRFQRLIEIECMSCHNGYPDFVSNSQNKYTHLKTGIDCERCHGPGSIHVAEKQKGTIVDTSKGPDYSIVNPRRLSVDLQNNLCQRCHLQGITVLNDDKSFFDFRPGMHLSEVMNVFMPVYTGAEDKMIMASHVERMKKSDCFVSSGQMSCITCHNPHISIKETPRSQYINTCMKCHDGSAQQKRFCTEKETVRAAKNNDCVTCHMPRNGSIDIPHVAVTDHYIRRKIISEEESSKITAFLGLKSYNNDNVDAITTGRAYMEFYERYGGGAALIDSALFYLNKQKAIEAEQKQNRDFIRAYFLLNDYSKVLEYARQLQAPQVQHAWTAYRIGESYFQSGDPQKALEWYLQATKIWKYSLDFQNKLGICYLALQQYPQALEVYRFILDENPDYPVANINIGFLYMQQGNNTMAQYYLSRALVLDPDNEQGLINMAVWYHSEHRFKEAKICLQRLLKKNPANERAKAMLMDLP